MSSLGQCNLIPNLCRLGYDSKIRRRGAIKSLRWQTNAISGRDVIFWPNAPKSYLRAHLAGFHAVSKICTKKQRDTTRTAVRALQSSSRKINTHTLQHRAPVSFPNVINRKQNRIWLTLEPALSRSRAAHAISSAAETCAPATFSFHNFHSVVASRTPDTHPANEMFRALEARGPNHGH